jgi:ubiquinone/menaquinone biosynthesis C-methylase UbiE
MTFKNIFSATLEKIVADFPKDKKVAIDLPAGNGETSRFLRQRGFEVHAFDLFPEFFLDEGLKITYCNINEGIPFPDSSADLIICQEGIEHFCDQTTAFREFNRVLHKTGKMVITTPNHSSLKSKLSYLLNESEKYSRIMSVNEYDSIWYNRDDNENQYYGHVFMIGITKLRLLGKMAGFKIVKVHFSHVKLSNVILLLIFYPFIFFTSFINYFRNSAKKTCAKSTYWELLKLNISPKIMVDGSLVVEFEKEYEITEAKKALYQSGHYDLTT